MLEIRVGEVLKIRKIDSLVLGSSFRSGVKARRQGGKRCMSMRSEGVILGAGSNPLVVPTAVASGRSHSSTFFYPYLYSASHPHLKACICTFATRIGAAASIRDCIISRLTSFTVLL